MNKWYFAILFCFKLTRSDFIYSVYNISKVPSIDNVCGLNQVQVAHAKSRYIITDIISMSKFLNKIPQKINLIIYQEHTNQVTLKLFYYAEFFNACNFRHLNKSIILNDITCKSSSLDFMGHLSSLVLSLLSIISQFIRVINPKCSKVLVGFVYLSTLALACPVVLLVFSSVHPSLSHLIFTHISAS